VTAVDLARCFLIGRISDRHLVSPRLSLISYNCMSECIQIINSSKANET